MKCTGSYAKIRKKTGICLILAKKVRAHVKRYYYLQKGHSMNNIYDVRMSNVIIIYGGDIR